MVEAVLRILDLSVGNSDQIHPFHSQLVAHAWQTAIRLLPRSDMEPCLVHRSVKRRGLSFRDQKEQSPPARQHDTFIRRTSSCHLIAIARSAARVQTNSRLEQGVKRLCACEAKC
jgi:hypothetical protein